MDYAHRLADESIERLERKLSRAYAQAEREMREKQKKFLKEFEREKSERLKALDDTPEARENHRRWLEGQAAREQWLGAMVDELAAKATDTNELAAAAIADTLPKVYSEGANYAAYSIDSQIGLDTSFTLVDEDTVRNLMMTSGQAATSGELLREITFPKVDRPKDYRWNRQKFKSAITQGILQGESIPNIVKRTKSIFGSNRAAAYRAARTATTSAENAGRVSSYKRAESIGIQLKQEWLATLDGRTRSSHRHLDGERVEVGEEFSNKCRFPGDPEGPAGETYNCRCTLVAAVDGVDQSAADRWTRLPEGMTYDEWLEGKPVTRAESYENESRIVGQGWSRQRGFNEVGGAVAIANPDARVWQAAGTEAYEKANALLAKADPLTAAVWSKYESELVLHDAAARSGFYRPGVGVTMNLKADMENTRRGNMSTWFHEFGHHIDGVASGREWQWVSRDKGLSKAVSEEVNAHVNEVHKRLKAQHKTAVKALDKRDMIPAIEYMEQNSNLRYLPGMYRDALEHIGDKAWFEEEGYPPRLVTTADDQVKFLISDIRDKLEGMKPAKAKAYHMVEGEIRQMTDAEKHSLSDMYEGATKGKVQAGWGHGKRYWSKNEDYQSVEAFAEFYSAECIYSETPQTLDTLKKYLPKSYERYREILKGMAEQ